MATYIILSQLSADACADPKDFKKLARSVSDKVRTQCPGVTWEASYATMGRLDVVDIVESDDPKQVEKAAMLIRCYGKSTTETLVATPWDDFLDAL